MADTRIVTTGTDRCAFCRLGQEGHEVLFWAWAQGDMTGEEVGAQVGLGSDAWRMHLKRHVPNYRVLAAEAAVQYGGEVEKVRARIQALAEEAPDPTDRMHLMEISVLTLRGHLLALTEKGFQARATTAQAAAKLAREIERATAALETTRRERELHEAELRARDQGDGWQALRDFQDSILVVLREHPAVWAKINDRVRELAGDRAVHPTARKDPKPPTGEGMLYWEPGADDNQGEGVLLDGGAPGEGGPEGAPAPDPGQGL